MRARKLFGPRTYFAKMVLFVSTVILIVVIVLSAAAYINAQNVLNKNENDSNQKLLYQIKYNIDLMDQTVTNLCKYLYVSSDIMSVMYAEQENIVDVSVKLNKVQSSLMSSSPYLHSITVYNTKLGESYTLGSPSFSNDPMLVDFMNANQTLPRLVPIFRDISKVVNGRTETERVFSYFIYDTLADEKPDGVVVINVKPEWLLENIRQINMIDPKKGDSIFIMDRQEEFLGETPDTKPMMEWLKRQFDAYKTSHPQAGADGYFKTDFEGKQYMITYTNAVSADLTLLKAQPVLEVYKYMNALRTNMLIVTCVFLAVALLLSFGISQRIYRPLGNLISTIVSDRGRRFAKDVVGDEISYLISVYRQSMEKLDLYDKERRETKDVMKHYWLNRLLTEPVSAAAPELETILCNMRISLPPTGPYAVIVLKIDRYKDIQMTFPAKERETLRFAIINIASEIVASSYPNEGLDMKDDHVVLIVGLPPGDESVSFLPVLGVRLSEARETVGRYFKITFTASIGEAAETIQGLPAAYHSTLNQAVYRFIWGHGSILTPELIRDNESNRESGYSKEAEERLLESIRARDAGATECALTELFEETAALNYYNALASILRLANLLKDKLDYAAISRRIVENETMDDILSLMRDALLESIRQEEEQQMSGPNHYVVEAVKAYIRQNYHDPGLCLTSIAAMMKMSSRRLSKLYKESEDMSIPDYINEVRLLTAADLLVRHHLSVYEIAEQVGILNDTYFFSMFKKRFGATPKEYALRKTADVMFGAPTLEPGRGG
ncbi:helix-turn-helix domain-containing protein [Paenibacillus hamazuiensis]|uniref:helix-turn-helix domain-containing protein n=1 Tax=Paenibacillus hamazuiensis TaxID=2936508 RepID=UPI00200C5EC2|nr:helix-turn-helix domain-containing protein [Paenibacillus hamazuiensis]